MVVASAVPVPPTPSVLIKSSARPVYANSKPTGIPTIERNKPKIMNKPINYLNVKSRVETGIASGTNKKAKIAETKNEMKM